MAAGAALLALSAAFAGGGGPSCPLDKLLAQAPDALSNFGLAAAISGDVAVVGSPQWNGPGNLYAVGAAYLFERQGHAWMETARLTAPSPTVWGGYAVDVDAGPDRVAVAAPYDGGGLPYGAVYVYERGPSGWVLDERVRPSTSAHYSYFGYKVDLDGDRMAVGLLAEGAFGIDPGAGHVFEREATGWVQVAELLSPFPSTSGTQFGREIAIDGDVAIVGSPGDGLSIPGAGAAFVFVKEDGAWNFQWPLVSPDPASGDRFGESVELAGDIAVVGAPGDDDQGTNSGSAWVFRRDGTSWSWVVKLQGSVGAAGGEFGDAVAIEGDRLLVGAPDLLPGGTVFAFEWTGSNWWETEAIRPADALGGEEFGTAVGLDGSRMVAGARNDHDGWTYGGSGYVYDLAGADCTPLFGVPRYHESVFPLQHVMQLDAGPAFAGSPYLLAASVSGTSPGQAVDGLTLPLNPDALFLHTVKSPNLMPYSGTFGLLDAAGRAEAVLAAPAFALGSLAGTTVHHAFVAIRFVGPVPSVGFVSNAEPLTIVP